MAFQLRIYALAALLWALALGLASPALGTEKATTPAGREPPKMVLVLSSGDHGIPWYEIALHGIQQTFAKAAPALEVLIYIEYTGAENNLIPDYLQELRDLYQNKYSSRRFDLIIALGDPAAEFIMRYCRGIFGQTPIVMVAETDLMGWLNKDANLSGIFGTAKIADNLELALSLHPGTKNIAVVSGASGYDQFFEQKARKIFQQYENRYRFIYFSGLTREKLAQELARLPPDTIVYYLLISQDGAGRQIVPRETLRRLSEVSNAPLYSLWDTFLGYGIVGGYLSSAEVAGERAARLGLRILRGESPSEVEPVRGYYAYMFDWRQMRKWGIKESALPAGSIVRFKDRSLWELYKWRIVLVVLAVVLGGLGYLTVRARLYKSKIKSQERTQKLLEEKVEERTASLQKANAELARLSNLDGLTSLHNRRHFDTILKHEWKRHSRQGNPLSLVMCDIDYFKKYNDTYGHQAGDDCLKLVAQAIRQNLRRPSDVAARYGGEEFALILANTDADGAMQVAHRIRQAIAKLALPHSASLVKPIISVSFGVASMVPTKSQGPEAIIFLADKALYQSKHQGRDQVRLLNGLQ